jgi:hypothetical protein
MKLTKEKNLAWAAEIVGRANDLDSKIGELRQTMDQLQEDAWRLWQEAGYYYEGLLRDAGLMKEHDERFERLAAALAKEQS